MTEMYAVVQKASPEVLVAVFLTEGDAKTFLDVVSYSEDSFYVKQFDLDWNHWIEYRKTIGTY